MVTERRCMPYSQAETPFRTAPDSTAIFSPFLLAYTICQPTSNKSLNREVTEHDCGKSDSGSKYLIKMYIRSQHKKQLTCDFCFFYGTSSARPQWLGNVRDGCSLTFEDMSSGSVPNDTLFPLQSTTFNQDPYNSVQKQCTIQGIVCHLGHIVDGNNIVLIKRWQFANGLYLFLYLLWIPISCCQGNIKAVLTFF